MARSAMLLLPAAHVLLRLASAQDSIQNLLGEGLQGGGQMSDMLKGAQLVAPTMDEEEELSSVMPAKYRCDACKAVMFQLDAALRAKQPRNRRLKQWEYIDLFEEVCVGESFKGYGLKRVMGVNELSGPGIKKVDPATEAIGSMQLNSDSWSARLGQECRSAVFEKLGEDEAYDIFYRRHEEELKAAEGATVDGGLTEQVCVRELRQCGDKAAPEAAPKKSKKKSKKEKKTKKSGKDKVAASPTSTKAPNGETPPSTAEGKLNVNVFLERLAAKNGMTAEQSTAFRTEAEWERFVLAMASLIQMRQQAWL